MKILKIRGQALGLSSYLQNYESYVTIFVENSQNKLERALNPPRPNFGFKAP
jgi:hypothetical protein